MDKFKLVNELYQAQKCNAGNDKLVLDSKLDPKSSSNKQVIERD